MICGQVPGSFSGPKRSAKGSLQKFAFNLLRRWPRAGEQCLGKATFPMGLYDDAVDSTTQALNCQIVILSVTPICALKIPGGIVAITFEGVTRLLWEGA